MAKLRDNRKRNARAAMWPELMCHCGRPVDTSEYHNRGMCTKCDDVRCDAYPGACRGAA